MRVNYDPRYVVPHQNTNTLEARLHVTKNIYGSSLPDRRLKDSMDHEAMRRRLKWSSPPKPTSTDSEPKHHSAPDKHLKTKDHKTKDASTKAEQASPESSPRPVRKSKKSTPKEQEPSEDMPVPQKVASTEEKTKSSESRVSAESSTKPQPGQEKFFRPREQVEQQDSQDKRVVKHREGVAKAHYTLHLQPLKPLQSEKATLTFNNTIPAQNQSKGKTVV